MRDGRGDIKAAASQLDTCYGCVSIVDTELVVVVVGRQSVMGDTSVRLISKLGHQSSQFLWCLHKTCNERAA